MIDGDRKARRGLDYDGSRYLVNMFGNFDAK